MADDKKAMRRTAEYIIEGKPHLLVVLAADIRKSAFAMKEAADPLAFAHTVSEFVDFAEEIVWDSRGWFDKFTGDGFLAYWPVEVPTKGLTRKQEDRHVRRNAYRAVDVADELLGAFHDDIVPRLRLGSQNMRSDVGLSIGLDAGNAHMARIASDVTIVGAPVVGAVRMVAAARTWECIANGYVGERLRRGGDRDGTLEVVRETRSTKEYEAQEIYSLMLPRQGGPQVYSDSR